MDKAAIAIPFCNSPSVLVITYNSDHPSVPEVSLEQQRSGLKLEEGDMEVIYSSITSWCGNHALVWQRYTLQISDLIIRSVLQ